jgi:hypothetical protein
MPYRNSNQLTVGAQLGGRDTDGADPGSGLLLLGGADQAPGRRHPVRHIGIQPDNASVGQAVPQQRART